MRVRDPALAAHLALETLFALAHRFAIEPRAPGEAADPGERGLAREAEMCYATVALSTDYDCWHEEEEDVTVEGVLATLRQNVANARRIIRAAILSLPEDGADCPCRSALRHAIMTAPERIPAEARARLAPLVGKYLG